MSEAPQFTEDDYNIDLGAVMEALGVNPATVKADSVSLRFLDGKPILEYTVIRAVPSRVLAVALLRGSPMELVEPPSVPAESSAPPQESSSVTELPASVPEVEPEIAEAVHNDHLNGGHLLAPCPVCGKQPEGEEPS